MQHRVAVFLSFFIFLVVLSQPVTRMPRSLRVAILRHMGSLVTPFLPIELFFFSYLLILVKLLMQKVC